MRRRAKRSLARVLARTLPRAALTAPEVFDVWERAGYHITPVHFYSPIPNTGELADMPPSSCLGIELNHDAQRQTLETLSPFFAEGQRHWEPNTYFGLADSVALYAMVRHKQPRTVVEVGSGHSTRMVEAALADNGAGELVTIEPHPDRMSSRPTFAAEVQHVPMSLFESLDANDVLFIDSSHVLRFGSDVQFEYLEILPRLKPGVFVHVHDVFLPNDYPRWWLTELHRFWNEQYILQAFLAFNHAFEVVWSSQMLAAEIGARLPDATPGGSFWMRRV